jgi:chromosome segregation protein
VQFQRLRLQGFKSFVEPTEFRIEPGLTGIVGPNGCGKSNLLEALRWVMGANSAKAMRAGGMDDVIFAGSGNRPARNHADVTLTIDNSDRTAPAQFNDDPTLEVVRRIDRGEGSTYRINGREVRARDVQLLFADASTGANSPALVRQGQISERIGAKPQNRRRILEEAAGVSGLHTRRHEAELRLRAAEANLSRLEDVARELETALGRLRREARQAEKYKRLSAEIRAVQGAVLYARWTEARDTLNRTQTEATDAARAVEETARAAAAAQTAILSAEGAMPPLREEASIAQAILGQLAIQKDRAEREAEAAQAEFERLSADLTRIDDDRARETQGLQDAVQALARADAELTELRGLIAAAPARGPELAAAAKAAEEARAKADSEVEQLAARAAAEDARARAAAQRLAEAESRLARTVRALDQAKAERAAVGPVVDPAAAEARQRFANAEAGLASARAALEEAEAVRVKAATAEAQSRDLARKVEDQLGRLRTEARGLAQLTAPRAKSGFSPALDAVTPEKGYGAALAAALGDDLEAALDPRAASFWALLSEDGAAKTVAWPEGVQPLAPLIKAPPELAARLSHVAVVARADGDRLAKGLPVGARLVSKEGDLWRWDGFVARADAPKPAAVRLEQRTRLAEVEAEVDLVAPRAEAVTAALKTAADALRVAEESLRDKRRGPPEAERLLTGAREQVTRFEREAAQREARAQSLDDTIARFEAERVEAETALNAVRAESVGVESAEDLAPRLTAARQAATGAREAAAAARSALDQETRETAGRTRRLESLERDHADWTKRREASARRETSLEADRVKAAAALEAAREAPTVLAEKLVVIVEQFAAAENRRVKASDALEAAETARLNADRAARAAEQAASEAREKRAGLVATLDAARDRFAEVATAIREQARMEPEELGRHVAGDAVAVPKDAAGVEAHLFNLERERDAIGPVNLRAEEEANEYAARLETMRTERADLSGAVGKLRAGIEELNAEGRERLLAAFDIINANFQTLFTALFGGGQAELKLIESDDPLEAGLEIFACPPGKRMASMSLMSGGEQALTASALIFGVFLANPAPICVLDEVDAPLDDANVDRYCNMLDEMRRRTRTRFIAITHNPVTMSRMDRLFGVTMAERGVSQLVSVDLSTAEQLVAAQ